MRRSTTPPYCHWRTLKPVKHKTYDANLRLVTVTRRKKSDKWYPAHDLKELLTKANADNKQHGLSTNIRKGTVACFAVERVPSATFPQDNFTAEELDAPAGYGYWKVDPESRTVTLLCAFDHNIKEIEKHLTKKALFRTHREYRPPLTRDMPDGWIVTDPLVGFVENRTTERYFPDPQTALAESVAGTLCWEVESMFYHEGHEDLARRVFLLSPRRRAFKADTKYWEVAGDKFNDPSAAFYRLLHYFSDRKRPVKIDDLYKQHVLRLYHPTLACWADVETWKCELAVRLFAASDLCEQLKSASMFRAGRPGGNAGEVSTSPEVMEWYRLLIKLLETPTVIYSGNNFKV